MSPAGERAPAKQAPPPAARADGLEVAVVASRFNGAYVERLVEGALAALEELGLARGRVAVYRCPGAFELPLLAREVARCRRPDGIVALGAVIRGETPHFDFVAGEAARGLMEVTLATGVPVGFGVITAATPEQAEARTRPPLDRGAEAARSVVEMAHALAEVRRHAPDRG